MKNPISGYPHKLCTDALPGFDNLSSQHKSTMVGYLQAAITSGNGNKTITLKYQAIYKHLLYLQEHDCKDIKGITCNLLLDYIKTYAMTYNKLNQLKNFYIHLYSSKTIDQDLTVIFPKIKRPQPMPTIYAPSEIKKIEQSIDRSTPLKKRNYAMLLLATRYGLRPSDIANLKYENIDFKNKIISIHQVKTGEPLVLPLLDDVASAIKDYCSTDKDCIQEPTQYLFKSIRYQSKLSSHAVSCIISVIVEKSGVNYKKRSTGPRAFRSSLASSMVNAGLPYCVARSVLGHTDPKIIKHYVKLDISNLRYYSLEVMQPTGRFKQLLEGQL